MMKWKNYGRTMGLLKNSEILKGVRKHREALDRALAMAGVSF